VTNRVSIILSAAFFWVAPFAICQQPQTIEVSEEETNAVVALDAYQRGASDFQTDLQKYSKGSAEFKTAAEGLRRTLEGVGTSYFWLGKYEEALDSYRKALDASKNLLGNEDDLELRFLMARAHNRMGKPDLAAAALEPIVKKERNPDWLYQLAIAYRDLKRPKDAIPLFEEVFKVQQDRYDVAFNLADMYNTDEQYSDAAETYKKAIALLGNSDREAQGDLYESLGTACMKLCRKPEAKEALQAAADIDAKHAELLGHFFLWVAPYENCQLPETIQMSNGKVDAAAALEAYRRAVSGYKADIQKYPKDSAEFKVAAEGLRRSLKGMSDSYFWLGNHEEALKTYAETLDASKILLENEDDFEIGFLMAQAYYHAGKPELTAATLEPIVKKEPNPDWLYQLAIAYHDLKRPKDAIPLFEEVFRTRKDSYIVAFYLADTYNADEQYGAAAENYRKSIALLGDRDREESGKLYKSLGLAYMKLCRKPEAKAAFEAAADIDPQYAELIGHLALYRCVRAGA